MVIIFLFLPMYAQDIGSWYTQYKTARAYQAGDIPTAHALYTDVVKAAPQDPLVNFNEGFLLYKQGDYAKAAASFERAAQSAVTGEQRQESYFNLGNAHAYQKEWQQSIDAYDKVLEQNAEHKRAKHNKEIVRKLLNQEKQQQQKDEQQKQNDKQDQQDKNESQDKQEQKSDNQQQKSPKEKEDTGNTPEQQKDQQQGNQDQGNDKGNDAKQSSDKHKQERSDKMNQEKKTQEEKSQEQKHTSPSSKNKSDYKTSSAGEQDKEQNREKDEIAQLLEQVDQKDTQQAKRLMHALLAQPKGGHYENKPSW